MREKYPLNPRAEMFRWGPAPIRLYYTFDYLPALFLYFPKVYKGESWPKGLYLSQNRSMVFVNEFPELRAHGAHVFLKHMLPLRARHQVYAKWHYDLENLRRMQKKIDKLDMPQLSLAAFRDVLESFCEAVEKFWIHVIVPELANYGSAEFLDKELKRFIKDSYERASVMETLTAPEALSFFQEEEVDLFKTADIKKHQRRYFWLKNSYSAVSVLAAEFFEDRKKELPADLLHTLRQKRVKILKDKKDVVKKYRLPQRIKEYADAIVAGIEWQDARKKDVLIYLHYKKRFIDEASKRLGIAKDDLLNFHAREICEMLGGKKFSKEIISRRSAFGYATAPGSIVPLSKAAACRYWALSMRERVPRNIQQLKGIVVSKGIGSVRGIVRILLDPYAADSFLEGEVLVAPMTTPEYIFAIKKSCAVVTDTGGLTSHAAVVSRELGKPCIVGTKYATKIFKDGDRVEVDMSTGVVRKFHKGKT